LEIAFPCEKVVREHLPAIKATLAKNLVENGMSQVQVSKLLGTTEATISHYMKGERGQALLGQRILDDVSALAEKISNGALGTNKISQEVCEICQKVRATCAVCGAISLTDCTDCTMTET
jgi:predicted transcriptional regulator